MEAFFSSGNIFFDICGIFLYILIFIVSYCFHMFPSFIGAKIISYIVPILPKYIIELFHFIWKVVFIFFGLGGFAILLESHETKWFLIIEIPIIILVSKLTFYIINEIKSSCIKSLGF